MIKLPNDKYGNEGWVVKARKPFWCDMGNSACGGSIQAGEHYYRAIAWPHSDGGNGRTPWVLRLCRDCLHDEMREHFDAVVASKSTSPEPTDVRDGA